MADGIAAVSHVQPQGGGQGFVLRVEQGSLLVAALDFLQEDKIRAQAIQAQAKFIQGVEPAQCRTALVNVVADDTDERHKSDGAF
ncbi:hypothetical protein D3C77_576350 [compost metagenome]